MTFAQPDIAALIGSRICHDLISPLGAISNGVELLTMTGAAQSPEIALIAESIDSANARIRYFRLAYGSASENQTMASSELRSILADVCKSTRLTITWIPEADIPRQQAKLVFLMLQCFETALSFGGRITVSQQNGRWCLVAEAERIKASEGLWQLLSQSGTIPDVNAADVQFLLVPQLLQSFGRTLKLEICDTRIDAQF
jgi:histidine phosphotransferase ChpT